MTASAPPLAPTPQQLAWQSWGIGLFVHVGVNTFRGVEWSDGTIPPAAFDPSDLDAREWVEAARAIGARYLVLTAKHHDGFCLWPTATTDYSVASSPWRDGRGDVVAEVARACREAGIGLGLYLSPWDRNAPAYADPDAYADLYVAQLTELCTRYGPLVELWFDGAGSEGYRYDWRRIMDVARTHQPDAMVFNMGDPTIRWVGNEDGLATDPVEYVVTHSQMSNYTVETIEHADALYLPPECDVSLRRGWFWRADDEPKSLEHLLAIYYRSVGLGANLLLNVPPDDRGRLDPADLARVEELGAELRRRFADPVRVTPTESATHAGGSTWRVEVPAARAFDHVRLVEDLRDGQRVVSHRVLRDGAVIAEGGTVGAGRLHIVATPGDGALEIELTGAGARLAEVLLHDVGDVTPPRIPAGYTAPTDYPES
ncbi:alpha-L-fucosidase [Salana multivorans]|uniref:alpha-L-fucosidase n=1 Tax=Salana multivorans TaxID=120377 RepID=A0A3N2DD20_9MICO|nr:alpha-L-fucosidase [Salana multivorans]OJX97983.1 MAG: alpha-L-fucosidase [Micrococcales bacterium 73-15]ROR97622.1 alpha-L-fucosidase [Salana multivorans]